MTASEVEMISFIVWMAFFGGLALLLDAPRHLRRR